MPTTLTALFATALHEAQAAAAEPLGIQRAAALLVTAAGARRIEWRIEDGRLVVNGFPLRSGAPGAPLVTESLERHLTRRLALPAGLSATQWVALAELYSTAPGIYPTADHMRAALNGIVPGVSFDHSADRVADDPAVADARHESRFSAMTDAIHPDDPAVVSRETELSTLSARIDPILDAGHKAVARADWSAVSELLLELDAIAAEGGDATRSIVVRERRRLLPLQALENLIAEVPTSGASSVELQALATLGREGAEAILELLAGDPPRARHRLYLKVLESITGADDVIITALGSEQDAIARDAAMVAGARRMERAVPVLGALLGHHNEQVRTAAWRALEDIGTAEAMALIR